jgi:hypothetical protein
MNGELPRETGVPVICDRGHQYISNAIALGAGTTATMLGNRLGPCPICGAMGSIVDGVYSVKDVAGHLVTTLRDLSRGEVIGIITELQRARRTRNEAQFDSAVARLPEQVRSEVQAVVDRENAKGRRDIRWALIPIILTILLWMYPEAGKETGVAVDHFAQSAISGAALGAEASENEVVKFVEDAISAFEKSLTEPVSKNRSVPKQGKVGRNDLCWCGSGKKYKFCHILAQRETDS